MTRLIFPDRFVSNASIFSEIYKPQSVSLDDTCPLAWITCFFRINRFLDIRIHSLSGSATPHSLLSGGLAYGFLRPIMNRHSPNGCRQGIPPLFSRSLFIFPLSDPLSPCKSIFKGFSTRSRYANLFVGVRLVPELNF